LSSTDPLDAFVLEHPEFEPIVPLVKLARGATELVPPMLVHTKVAARIWPFFAGAAGEFPPAGAASLLGVLAVWAPALDQFVKDPELK
jgi:hypothetical protein